MSRLLQFIRDDLHILLAIAVGAHLIVAHVERRRLWPLRVALSLGVIGLWMYLTGVSDYRAFGGQSLLLYGVVRYSALFMLNVLAVMACRRAGFYPALFAATVGYSLQHFCERSWEIARAALNLPVALDRLALIAYMALVIGLCDYLVLRKNGARQVFVSFERLDRRILLLIAVVVIGVSIVMDLWLYDMLDATAPPNVYNYSHITSAIIALLVLVISNCHLQETESERRAEIADQLLHQEKARYLQEKDIHDAINIKCHDIRHQIAALGEKGYRRELNEIGKLVNIYDTAARSENLALDIVLSNKSLACLNKGVTLSCIADGRQLSFMADEDVYALFGNILDNAIEAAAGIADPERRQITLTVRQHSGFLFIEEVNFFDGEVRFDNGLPLTSKRDTLYHGFGTQSIRMLVERYDGDLRFSGSDGIFQLSIMLPVPQTA